MSIPISSTSTGMPPSEVTQSAMVSAPTSWAASQIGCPWLYSPVEVSACTKATTRGCRSEEHTSELQSLSHLVCRLLLEKKKETRSLSACLPTSSSAPHHEPPLLAT